MNARRFSDIAVIADAHFHDLSTQFANADGSAGNQLTLRSWSDTRQSTRVFNESGGALMAALSEVARRQVRHVVLLGDYTDDGQKLTTAALADVLSKHHQKHGTAFYALPGNHDIFGPLGRHHTKEFLTDEAKTILVSSDHRCSNDGVIVTDGMYCAGYPEGLSPMAEFGYFRRASYLHWETPFGTSDAPSDRLYKIASPDGCNVYNLMDASYLVEPEEGLWLLMIDANVFEPLNGEFEQGEEAAFTDSTSGGWNAVLRSKPFILSWMRDVARRSRLLGKTLLAFSHYPALDPFDGAADAERFLFGETNVVRRTPRQGVGEAFVAAGIEIHFSGHLHVEGLTKRAHGGRKLINVAVPSLVAFPPAFKILSGSSHKLSIEAVELASTPVNGSILAAYAKEMTRRSETLDRAFVSRGYGEYLRLHKLALITHRYFVKEWPLGIAASVSAMNVWEAAANCSSDLSSCGSENEELAKRLPMTELIADWYCLRQGSCLALGHIEVDRLKLYRCIAECCGRAAKAHNGSVASFLATFFGALGSFLDRAEGSENAVTIQLCGIPDRIFA